MNAIPTSKFQNLNTGTTFTLTKNVSERQPTLTHLHPIFISHTFQTNKQTLHTLNEKYCFCFITNFIVLLKVSWSRQIITNIMLLQCLL